MNSASGKRFPNDEIFVADFAKRILEKGAGIAPEHAVIDDASPKRMFFNGVLCAQRPDEDAKRKKMFQIYRPPSCGLDFVCAPDEDLEIHVDIALHVFGAAYQPFDTLGARAAPVAEFAPPLRYVRHPVRISFSLRTNSLSEGAQEVPSATAALVDELDRVSTLVLAPPNALREADLSSPQPHRLERWEPSLYEAAVFTGSKAQQRWKAAVYAQAARTPIGLRIQVFLQNDTEDAPGALDGNFYGVSLRVCVPPNSLREIPLERAPLKDYRYRRSVVVQGVNCNSVSPEPGVLETCFAPSYEQRRYLPLSHYDLSFNRLTSQLEEVFAEIERAMTDYERAWRERLRIGELGIESDGDLQIAASFHAVFLDEIERIREAIALIRNNPRIQTAFILMNETFAYMSTLRKASGARPISGWYLFQLCFILSVLPSVVERSQEKGQFAHLLWFPTGGGKTEAVMGVTVFAMFLERLSGRSDGVTAWMRFPLRLLTFQQMQRYVDVIIAADEVREREAAANAGLGGAPFTLGYFGGRRNSPNDLRYIPDDVDVPSKLFQRLRSELQHAPSGMDVLLDPEGRLAFQHLKLVGDCFYCGRENTVEIVGDREALTMRHKCAACSRVLPIFTVDQDLYTQVPTVLVGTLDKLATIGFRAGFRTLVGKGDGKCAKHGHGIFGKCLKSAFGACGHADWRVRPAGEGSYGGISILFQDELHLIHEQLGCFDAHYESLLMSLCGESSGKRPLVLAASATIEGAVHQIDHLYESPVVRFPGEGPSLRETFYARETDDLQRVFVGIKPSNLAHLDTTMALTTFIFEEISDLRNRRDTMEQYYPSLRGMPNADYEELIDRHELTVAYVNSKRDGQNIRRSVDEQVRDALLRGNRDQPYGIESLTGDSTMDEVKDALRRMNSSRSRLPDKEKLDFAVATSMISHGVDVDRLNTMIFYSFPRTTAEYIQASSRAGRTYPGIVFVVLKSTTYRDRSFYRNFREVHAAIDKMVESVPIDRYAVHAVERTAPGLATGTLINRTVDQLRKTNSISLDDAREIDNVQTLKRLVIGGLHFKDAVKEDLDGFYNVSDPRASDWRADLVTILDELDTNISTVESGTSIPRALNYSGTRVMTSLRDVEPPVDVLIKDRIFSDEGGADDE